MNRFDCIALVRWMTGVLQASGTPASQAALTADVLGRTSLRGIDTHGVSRIPGYVRKIRAGEITGRAPQTQSRNGALFVDGGGALGQVVASQAVEAAVRATDRVAAAPCVVTHSGHLSALGLYALQAAEQGRLALVCQRTPPIMGLTGSPGANIGNNPLAFAAPVKDGAPLVFDIANSVAARGHIMQAARAAKFYLQCQVEAGHGCPIAMTFAATRAIQMQPDLAAQWLPKITARHYDPRNIPAEQKQAVTIGMAMTHIDMYDKPQYVTPAGAKLKEFFGRHLA